MRIKLYSSTEKMFSGHSLISNKYPKGVSLQELLSSTHLQQPQVDLERLGLFEVSSPDFSKYYPEVTAKDLQPSDEDFVYPIYRALSKVVVNKYGPIDFGFEDVLKRSMKKLIGQSVYPNHDANTGNELGVVVETAWQEERKYDGFTVPAGFNSR